MSDETFKVVGIETFLGARYVFPDLRSQEVANLILEMEREGSTITLANISGAALVVPKQIVKKLYMDDQEIWVNPREWWNLDA